MPQPAAVVAAEGAWRLAERFAWIDAKGQPSDSGRRVAALAQVDPERRREGLAPVLALGVEAAMRGQNGLPIIPLLRQAAQTLAASRNLWVRTCPGLVPVEVGAIVYWACVDRGRVEQIVRDIEINRDVAMHRLGSPDDDAPPSANTERHFDGVLEFYVRQPDLGGRVPFSFGQEMALARLLGYSGLFSRRACRAGDRSLDGDVSPPGCAYEPKSGRDRTPIAAGLAGGPREKLSGVEGVQFEQRALSLGRPIGAT